MTKIDREGVPAHGWLIHKAGRGWYRAEAKGYTAHPSEAGRYSYSDALSYSHPNGMDGPRDGLTIKHESELPQLKPDPKDEEIRALRVQLNKAEARVEETRALALQEAVRMADCACDHRDAVLKAASENSAAPWQICGRDPCGALDAKAILALMDTTHAEALERVWAEAVSVIAGVVDDCLLVDDKGVIVGFEYYDFQTRLAAIRARGEG